MPPLWIPPNVSDGWKCQVCGAWVPAGTYHWHWEKEFYRRSPHVCPICNGRGQVPERFYNEKSADNFRVACRTCHGSGVIWEP
jgi:DnaJ-class molecular chaperone